MEQLTPQYDYSSGLPVEVTTYQPDHVEHETVELSPEELRLPDGPTRLHAYNQVDALMAEPRVEKTPRGDAIEFVILNDDSPDGELEVMHLEWHTAVRDPGVRPLLAAFLLTGRRRMVVSSSGMGNASPLPRSVAHDMAKTGSFIPASEHMFSAYDRIVSDYDALSISGTSEGGRRALGLAALFDHVQTLFSHDAPGSRQIPGSWLGMGRAFLSEMEYAKEYVAAAQDPELIRAQHHQDGLRRFGHSVLHQLRVGNMANLVMREPQAMGRAGLRHDALAALPHIDQRFVLSVPTFSRLNNPDDVYAIAADVRRGMEERKKPDIVALSFAGSHSSGAANMPVTARLYELAHGV